MNKKCYDYKQLFEQQPKLRKIWFFTFTNGIEVYSVLSAVFIALMIYLLFGGLVLFINSILPGSMYLIYTFVPYKIASIILNSNTDGQKIHFYIKDLVAYLIQILIPKRSFCDDEAVKLSQDIVFEKFE